jgi:hypothetical protein
VTVSGAGLAWTLVSRANTQFGTAEIWTATASAPLVNRTVTSTQSVAGSFDQSLTVVAFEGAAGVGASVAGGGNDTAPGVSLITSRAGSPASSLAPDGDRALARTPEPSRWRIRSSTAPKPDILGQNRTLPVGCGSRRSDTAPINDRWNLAAVEIIPR